MDEHHLYWASEDEYGKIQPYNKPTYIVLLRKEILNTTYVIMQKGESKKNIIRVD